MKPTCEKCGHEMDILYVENKQTLTICPNCNYEILKALPSASEEQIQIASAVLRRVYDCGHCAKCEDRGYPHRGYCSEYGEPVYHKASPTETGCWTEREKGGSDDTTHSLR